MTIVTTMCKLLFAMVIGFFLYKKQILTKEVNAKLSSLIIQVTCPCIILNSLSTVSHDDTGMVLKLFLSGVVMYLIFPILAWIITKLMRVPAHFRMCWKNAGIPHTRTGSISVLTVIPTTMTDSGMKAGKAITTL